MKIKILSSAADDLADGFNFYENQLDGLGSYFLETLFSDIESLKIYAGVHQKVFGYHRLLSNRFPYAVYYSLDSGTIFVNAILDCRRNPEWVKKRFASEI